MLWIHIAGGTLALITGLGAMFSKKGSDPHRKFGKVYFWSMTAVFVGALIVAIGHNRMFLLMVAFFSYYMTVRGYRMLYLKGLSSGHLGRVYCVPARLGRICSCKRRRNGYRWIGFRWYWINISFSGFEKFFRNISGENALVVWSHCEHGWKLYLGRDSFYSCECSNRTT
jgi:uncharacterized membrane protein